MPWAKLLAPELLPNNCGMRTEERKAYKGAVPEFDAIC